MSCIEDIKQALLQRNRALANLHVELGFDSPQDLIHALQTAAQGQPAPASRHVSPPKRARPVASSQTDTPSKGRRLSGEVRKAIQAALKDGNKGAEVARQFGISYPTLHKIKSDLGLVTTRGSKPKGRRRKVEATA